MAEKTEVYDAIEALAVHCRPPLMSVEQRTLWLRDWANDLAEFPLDSINTACRKWRHSGTAKFPTAGQLLPLIRESLPVQGERVQIWRPATASEYAAMSLREKIREHTILAHEAGSKAGPMFRNTSQGKRMMGVHLDAEEMPDNWRIWKAEEKRHLEEASRLRSKLFEAQRAPMAAE
ncbi:hypothetical protein [Phenylobacterium sp. J367]|uniref:hypothetical protein n=1 Tax=Phenylobacterium sp. J367 TaxID=2898435 RepID=UPI0021513106|nr:hypothetical protein [Phenylobacterium sp. J367]MCR5876948.1 hypothetical protein [Phenylobacterium sp. J367]MCR5877016.1 hypothetical protein [Phenylobacterium sp. J367]